AKIENLNYMKSELISSVKKGDIPSYLGEYLSDIGIGHIVELREYNPHYKEIFSRESERIASIFDQLPISLHHIGSTSVEGLCAKPIIDILLTYPETVTFESVKKVLVDAGYFFREDLFPERTYFVLENDKGIRYFAITVYMSDDVRVKELLTFRDKLRDNPSIMEEYMEIKRKLSAETTNRQEYTNQKSEFIQRYSK
ncbi:MAG: hypothetical protein QG606_154, partial [Patescibacteria group bacterium]|nr:hypothetical protein [Patescibacteria group bacterium]